MENRPFLWLRKTSELVSLAADPSLSYVEWSAINAVEVDLYSYTSIPSIHLTYTLYLYVCHGIECTSSYLGRQKASRETMLSMDRSLHYLRSHSITYSLC